MTDRASIFEGAQIGMESVPGGSVAATKRLGALSIEPSIKANVKTFKAGGNKFATLASLGQEWMEASLKGQLTYNELIYPLTGLFNAVVSGSSLGNGAYKWNFGSSASSANSPKTMTIEQGSSVRAARFAYGLVTGMTITFNRNEAGLSGDMIGQAIADNVSMSAGATMIDLVPVHAKEISVYMDDTAAGLGGTLLTRLLSGSWGYTDAYAPLWTVNAAEASFAAHVEKEPKLAMKLKMEADAQGMGLLTTMRNGAKKFIRIEAIGSLIGGSNYYKLTIDTCGLVSGIGKFEDADGVFAVEFDFDGAYDGTWTKSMDINVTNGMSGL